jgi:hypothetical protein
MRGWLTFVALVACGNNGGGNGNGSNPGGGDGGVGVDAAPPEATCTPLSLVDTSSPTTTITDCSDQAALTAAAATGGTIVFSCGSAPVTIPITQTIMFAKDTVVDGGGLVTLDGGGTTRI